MDMGHLRSGLELSLIHISSSTDQMPERPFDILSGAHEDLPAFLDHLRQHGYTESHLAKLAGENWLHTFRHILKH